MAGLDRYSWPFRYGKLFLEKQRIMVKADIEAGAPSSYV